MNKNSKYIKVYSNCIAVKGSSRAIICDLGRQNYVFVPIDLVNLFYQKTPYTLDDLIKLVGDEARDVLEEYLEFLIHNEFIFFCDLDEFNLFPDLSLTWENPSLINNAIVDIENNVFNIEDIVSQFEELGCMDIQFRFFKNQSIETYYKILQLFNNSRINSIEIILPFDLKIVEDDFERMISFQNRIKSIIVYNSPESELKTEPENNMGAIYYLAENILNKLNCGVINHQYFSLTTEHFTESHFYNTCLNRKISIDTDGNIRNCPSMKESYGNIKSTKLLDAINSPNFKKYWNIKKDDIAVCKDCEFRHICTDCRAFLETPEDIYSKPLKCGYNPYTNTWEEWSTNPLKQKAIEFYGMNDLIAKL